MDGWMFMNWFNIMGGYTYLLMMGRQLAGVFGIDVRPRRFNRH